MQIGFVVLLEGPLSALYLFSSSFPSSCYAAFPPCPLRARIYVHILVARPRAFSGRVAEAPTVCSFASFHFLPHVAACSLYLVSCVAFGADRFACLGRARLLLHDPAT